MALPYDAIVPVAPSQPKSTMRLRAVGAAFALAMVACVALLGTGKTPPHLNLSCAVRGSLRPP